MRFANKLPLVLTLLMATSAWAQNTQDPSAPPAASLSGASGAGASGNAATQSPAVLLQQGIYQEETAGDLAAAARTYRQIIAQASADRTYVAQALYRLGAICLKQKQIQEAVGLFTRLKNEYPEQKDLLEQATHHLAEARAKLDEKEVAQIVDSAVAGISTMTEADPRLPATLATLEGLDQGMVLKELVAKLASSTAEARRAAIYILWKGPIKDITPAVPALEKLLTHEEFFTRGMAALALGGHKIDSAYESIVKLATDDASPYARRCAVVALAEMGKPEGKGVVEMIAQHDKDEMVHLVATKMLETHWKAGESQSPAEQLAHQGWHLWYTHEYLDAEAQFKKAVEKDPSLVFAWNGLGWAQFDQGKNAAARTSFEKAVELDPRQAASLNGLGWIAKNAGQTSQAKVYWKRAVDAAPTATAALSGLGETALENGDYDQAVDWYQRWLKVQSDNVDAKSGLNKALAGRDALRQAPPAAKAWLSLIDTGKYAQSWSAAAALFKASITADGWEQSVRPVCQSLGALVSRKLKSAQYSTSLPGCPDGQYVVIQYDSQFEHADQAIETVTLMKDPDGVWRVAGCYVKPGAPANTGGDAVQQALPAAQAWLKLLDEGKYAQSWSEASSLFKASVTSAGWDQAARPVAQELGALVSRKLKSAQYSTSIPGCPDGQYVVIQYDSQFEHADKALETVTLMKDPDGVWRVVGCFVKPSGDSE